MKQRELIVRFLRSLISYGACPDKSDYSDKASRNPYDENARKRIQWCTFWFYGTRPRDDGLAAI